MFGEQLLIANCSPPQLLIANFPNIGNYLTKALQRERGRDISSPAIWVTKICAHFGDKNVAQMSRQICSHTPCALNAGAKRSDVPYDHASMLLLGEGSEATEPYNKYANLFNGFRTFRHKTFQQQDGGRRFGNFLLPKRLWCRNVFTAGERRFGNIL